MTGELVRTAAVELEVPTGEDNRILVRTWTAPNGKECVTVAPQHIDRSGTWRLTHSGLILRPTVARALAPALIGMAATIDEVTT